MLDTILTPNLTTVLLGATTFGLAYLWVTRYRKPADYPPGPTPIPIITTLSVVASTLRGPKFARRQALESAEVYGPVSFNWFGPMKVVIIHSVEAMKEAFNKKTDEYNERLQNRVFDLLRPSPDTYGPTSANGAVWRALRRFSLHALRDMGMGKMKVAESVHEAADTLIKEFDQTQGQPIDPKVHVHSTVAEIIGRIVFGPEYERDSDRTRKIMENLSMVFSTLPRMNIVMLLPFLERLPGDLFCIQKITKAVQENAEFIKHLLKKHEESYDNDVIRDIMDAYIHEMREVEANNSSEKEHFTPNNLVGVVGDLYGAGFETTATTLRWCLAYIAVHQDIQERMHQEIDENIGNRQAQAADRSKCVYTEAFIMEILRYVTIIITVPHYTTTGGKLYDYTIPEGTMVLPYLYTAHHSKQNFPDPETFKPDRFIGEQGDLVKNENWVPFGVGRRSCVGEGLARVELFIILTRIIQKFKVTADGKLDLDDAKIGITTAPTPHKLIFQCRHN